MADKRFQIGRSDSELRTRLYPKATLRFRARLIARIRKANGRGEVKWRVGAGGEIRTSKTVVSAVGEMLDEARKAKTSTRISTVVEKDVDAASVHLWALVATVQSISGSIPPAALKANRRAIRKMLAFHEELSFVFPDYKTLGGYLPRPIKSDIPVGWTPGDPWPGTAYASEHAWGDADDAGKRNASGGYDVGKTLKPFLARVTVYVLANRDRLGLVDHIFDGSRYHARDGFEKTAYTGSDDHSTHTHSAFAEHNGARPPWL